MSNAQFRRDFAKVLQRAGANAENVVRAGGLEILKRLIEKSPVGDPSMWQNPDMAPEGYVGGRFKNNWNVQVSDINYDTSAPVDSTGGSAMQRGQGTLTTFPMGATIFITNSMPYSRRLEFDAWSDQASAGMVRVTAIEYQNIIKQVAAAIT
ncbi:MAG: hypothetical protein WA191_06810 [Telluria sp.]